MHLKLTCSVKKLNCVVLKAYNEIDWYFTEIDQKNKLLFYVEILITCYYLNAGLGVDFGTFFERETSNQTWTDNTQRTSGKYIGVPVIITNDNGRFKVAVQGVEGSTLTSIVITTPKPSWFVTFWALTDAELIFSEPCMNDFSP